MNFIKIGNALFNIDNITRIFRHENGTILVDLVDGGQVQYHKDAATDEYREANFAYEYILTHSVQSYGDAAMLQKRIAELQDAIEDKYAKIAELKSELAKKRATIE